MATQLTAALPLAAASPAAARCAAAGASSEAPRPVAAAAAPLRRRAALGAALGAALLAVAPREARAYGGSGNIRSTDEGSGNPRCARSPARSLHARAHTVTEHKGGCTRRADRFATRALRAPHRPR
jgi:hypothetical protein